MSKNTNLRKITNYLTADNNTLSSNVSQTITGSLTVTGNLTAQQFILSSSVTYLTESFASGSHKFGDSSDDNHNFTGSLIVSGSANPLRVGSNLLFVSSSGVGIGTSSPASGRKLTIAGGTQFTTGDNSGASFNIVPGTAGQDGADLNLSYYTGTGFGPLTFTLSGSERMRITPTGNVGIGVTTVSYSLQVNKTGTDSTIWGYNIAQFGDSTTNASGFRVGTSTSTSGLTNLVAATNNDPSQFAFWTWTGSAWGERMRITSGGNVGIGTNAPAEKLHIYGGGLGPEIRLEGTWGSFYIRVYNDNFNIYTPQGRNAISIANNGNVYNYSNTTSWQTTSDIRVKENINTIENALNVITSLNPVSFNYKQEFAEKNNWDDTMKLNNIGFIAQEFETVFPKYVYTKEYMLEDTPIEDFKSIDTGHLVPYLVKAIQELSAKNNELQEILQRNNIV